MGVNGTTRYIDFDALLKRHGGLVRNLCWWHAGGDSQRTSDLMQEVVLHLWHYRHMLREGASLAQERHWVRLHCRSVFQHEERKQQVSFVSLTSASDVPAEEEDAAGSLIDQLAADLSDRERQVLELVLDDYTDGEIDSLLRLVPGEARRLHATIIEKMKQKANIKVGLTASKLEKN